MAIYEFTQQFSFTDPSATVTVMLQPNPGTYIIKGMSCYSTTGIINDALGTSLQVLNVNAISEPTIVDYIFSTDEIAAANTSLILFTPTKQVILTMPYIGFAVHIPSNTGTFVVNLSYVYIPASNTVESAKFGNHVATISGGVGAAFTGLSANCPTIIKSILVANTVNASTVITMYLDGVLFDTEEIETGGTYIAPIPIYLSDTQTLTVGSSASSAVQVIYSYTLDPTE